MITLEISESMKKSLVGWLEEIESTAYDDQYSTHLSTEAAWLLTELRNFPEVVNFTSEQALTNKV